VKHLLQICTAVTMLSFAGAATAETCLELGPDGSPQPLCMSTRHRLSAIATADGIDGGKHIVYDIGNRWRMNHRLLPAVATPSRVSRLLYSGKVADTRRNGVSLGAELAVGRFQSDDPASSAQLGALRGAARIELDNLIEHWQVALGALLLWDMDLLSTPDTLAVAEHRLAPLSAGLFEMQRASNPSSRLGVRVEAGRAWSSNEGWSPLLVARAGFEQLVMTVGEKPLWLYATASYESTDDAVRGELGFKVPLPTRWNPR
jgi:hypothetical protein